MSLLYALLNRLGAKQYINDNVGEDDNEGRKSKIKNAFDLIVHTFAGALAGYIAWHRNAGLTVPIRLVMAIVAFIFGILYLVYFVGFVLVFNVWNESLIDRAEFIIRR